MSVPIYNPLNTPEDNLRSLIEEQKDSGLTAATPNGVEPLDVLVAKAAFNAQQKAEQGGGGEVSWNDVTGKPTAFNPDAHAINHSPSGEDTLSAYYAEKNGEGLSYITVDVSGNEPVANGTNLLAAYAAAKLLTPSGSPLSALNRATVIVPPANYDLSDITLTIDSDYVDVVASANGTVSITGTVTVTSEDAKVQGLGSIDQNAYGPVAHASTHNPDGTDPITGYVTNDQLDLATPLTFLSDDTGAVTAYDLTATPDSWQDSNYSLTAVYGGSKLTSVGNFAFFGCSSLTSISLPAATSIGSYAFKYCNAIASVSLPSAITIGVGAFWGCGQLASISIPSATTIGALAFSDCSPLTRLALPSATSIGAYAFSYTFISSGLYINAPFSGVDEFALVDSSVTTIHLRPAPHTPAGWTLGPDQEIGGAGGVTVVADWTTYPDLPV